MNRIQHLVDEFSSAMGPSPTVVESGRFERAEQDALHAFFSPLHYERNYAYPLIVWLHGPNDDERQLRRIMPLVSMRNYVAVAPRGTVSPEMADDVVEPRRGFTWAQTSGQIVSAEQRVFAAVSAACRKFNVNRARIFVAGFDCGGTMALRLALNHPTYFAGGASFGGAFPAGFAPLGRLNEIRRLKLLVATGRDSSTYPIEQVCEHLRLFHSAGMAVCLRQYPCGDDLTTTMLADMDRWIMDQIVAQPAVAADEPSAHGR
jgi:phospholipase/carboxylesterase